MQFDSRRADADGYLEFIWRKDSRPEGTRPQAIAFITDMGYRHEQWFFGCYGIHTVQGPTVAAVKEQLFSLIEEAGE